MKMCRMIVSILEDKRPPYIETMDFYISRKAILLELVRRGGDEVRFDDYLANLRIARVISRDSITGEYKLFMTPEEIEDEIKILETGLEKKRAHLKRVKALLE